MMSRSIRFISAALAVATLAAAGRYVRIEAEYKAPAVTLVDSTGVAVRLDRLLATDQPVALQFIFTTCPGVCPTLTATLAELGRRVPEARLVSISIDPEVDTPARLAEYKERSGAGEGWRFLTGRNADVIAAQKAFDSYRGEKMRHQPLTFVRPAGSESWVRFEGYPTATELALELAR